MNFPSFAADDVLIRNFAERGCVRSVSRSASKMLRRVGDTAALHSNQDTALPPRCLQVRNGLVVCQPISAAKAAENFVCMTPPETFSNLLRADAPMLSLAPMQDVTTLQFMRVIARYGGPDVFWTEYFRVHGESRPEKWILDSITQNPTGRPVVAQLIGNDIPALVRNAKLLQQYPVAAIDLNLGCPAPIVYRKCAGGGLLREPKKIDAILSALREAVTIPFTVKTRLGFTSPAEFDALLAVFAKHPIDLLTIHARTVTQMYRPGVRYDLIAHAAKALRCPVLLNGNVFSAPQAQLLLAETGVCGLMIGRGAIRNPWLFDQIRAQLRGEKIKLPGGRDVLAYIHELWDNEITPGVRESAQVQRMKKFTNFIGEGIGEKFLHDIRRAPATGDFWRVCENFLDHDEPMTLEPASLPNKDGLPQEFPL